MLTEITDGDKNRLYFQGHEVFLALASGGRTRKLGEVLGETLHTFRDLRKHEMRHQLQVGFNWHLIRFGMFKRIVLHTQDGREFYTSRKWLMKYGKVCKPARGRFELQIFLNLSEFRGFEEPSEPPAAAPKPPAQESLEFA